jgi:hypothetical protein
VLLHLDLDERPSRCLVFEVWSLESRSSLSSPDTVESQCTPHHGRPASDKGLGRSSISSPSSVRHADTGAIEQEEQDCTSGTPTRGTAATGTATRARCGLSTTSTTCRGKQVVKQDVTEYLQLLGRASVDLFQMQRGSEGIDGWYHVRPDLASPPLGAIKIAVVKRDAVLAADTAALSCGEALCDSAHSTSLSHGQSSIRAAVSMLASSGSALSHVPATVTGEPTGEVHLEGHMGSSSSSSCCRIYGSGGDDKSCVSSQQLRESLRRNMLELDHIQLRLRGLHNFQSATSPPPRATATARQDDAHAESDAHVAEAIHVAAQMGTVRSRRSELADNFHSSCEFARASSESAHNSGMMAAVGQTTALLAVGEALETRLRLLKAYADVC